MKQILSIIFHFGSDDLKALIGTGMLYLVGHPVKGFGTACGLLFVLLGVIERVIKIIHLIQDRRNEKKVK